MDVGIEAYYIMSDSAIPPVAIPPATPGGTDMQVQFNDAGALGGDAGLTYNKTTDTLTVGIVTGNGAVPVGGTLGQSLTKVNATDYNTQWATVSAGSGDANYIFSQLSPSAVWNVPHNLGKFPSIEVVDSGGSTIVPNILYVDSNNLTVSFGAATSGKVYCN